MAPNPTGIPALVGMAVLGAAVLHAAWNALAKSVEDHLVGFAVLDLSAGLLALAVIPFVAPPASAAWPFMAVSVGLHTAYQAFLLTGYSLGDLNQVYPIARGTAPLAVAVIAVPAAGERLGALALVGLLAVAGGLIGLAGLRPKPRRSQPQRSRSQRIRLRRPASPSAVGFAFATGLAIAAYTVVDGLGVRRAGGAAGYAAWLLVADAVPVPAYAIARRADRLRAAWASTWRRASVGGALSLAAYGIVLWAQTRGALAAVAALRETSVIVAALIGATVFGEGFGRRRTIAAAVVATGVVLLNTG